MEAGLNVVSFLARMLGEDTSSFYAKHMHQNLGEFCLSDVGVYVLGICL